MAGKKGASGGKREGAGRKPLPPEQLNTETPISVTENQPKRPEFKYLEKKVAILQTCDLKDLKCPIEFNELENAKKAWEYCIELNNNSKYKLLNERHYEVLKSYCLAVEIRQSLIAEWFKQGKATTIITRQGEIKINPVVTEISKKSDQINTFADALGLTVLSEFKMAKEQLNSPKLSGDNEEKEDDGMFD